MQSLRRRLPPQSTLLAFEAAARLGSFTKAAVELGITQAAVSLAVRQLEGLLGQPLFHRQHRAIQLTDGGRRLFNDVSIGLGHIAGAVDALRRQRQDGPVSLSVSTAFATHWMLPRLARFKQILPDVELNLRTSDQDVDLMQEGVQLGIRRGAGDWGEYEAARFEDEVLLPICAPSFLRIAGRLQAPADLLRCHLIHLEEPFRPRPTWSDWFAAMAVQHRDQGDGLRVNDYAIVIAAALGGEGVALGWQHIVRHHLETGRLVAALDRRWTTGLGFYVVWPRGEALTANAAKVRDWIVAEGRAAPPLASAPRRPLAGLRRAP